MKPTLPLTLASAFLLLSPVEARNFFELANQGFQNGGQSGVRSDRTYQFNGPVFVFEEPDYFGPKSGLVDANPDGPTVWGRVSGGYDSNPVGYHAEDGAWFGALQVGASENFSVGPQNIFVGGRARVRQFDSDIYATGRDGNESTIMDLDLRVGTNREFNQSVELTAFHQANLGGSREFGQPYVLPGVNRQDYLLYRAASQLVYRFDGAPVNDPGLQLTTALRGTFLIGLDNDNEDFRRSEVRQSIDRISGGSSAVGAVGLEGRFGYTSWDDWDELDSTSLYALATSSGKLANGIHYHAAAGWEWWNYDDGSIDNRDDFYAELKISGELTNELYIAGGLTYGIDTVRPDQGAASADPMALKAAVTGVWDNGQYTVASLLTYTWYEAELMGNASGHWDRWSAGVSIDRELWTNSRVGLSFEYARIDTHLDNYEDIETLLRWTQDF